jgi:hypothetical protein
MDHGLEKLDCREGETNTIGHHGKKQTKKKGKEPQFLSINLTNKTNQRNTDEMEEEEEEEEGISLQ